MAKIKRNPAALKIADLIFENYDLKNANDANEALKEVFGPLFEKMLNAEMDAHLGYDKNSQDPKETENRRNGFGEKTIQGSFGETKISVPRDREGTFEPVIVPKRKKDVSEIEGKVLAMYARGMSQRDISSTIQDIYGFELSQDNISTITDTILEDVKEWLNRPLKPLYRQYEVTSANVNSWRSLHIVYLMIISKLLKALITPIFPKSLTIL